MEKKISSDTKENLIQNLPFFFGTEPQPNSPTSAPLN